MPKYQHTVTITGPNGFVDFVDFGIPETVKWGGPQRLNVHKQPGGARQIDVMGNDPDPIEWSGLLLQTNAVAEATKLLTMKEQGNPVIVVFGGGPGFDGFQFHCVIEDVTCVFHSNAMIEYKIKCVIITDGDNAALGAGAPNLGGVNQQDGIS